LLSVVVGDSEKTAQLLAAGASLQERGPRGRPPLQYALMAGRTAMLQWLLSQGVEPDAADKDGKTALMLAAEIGDLSCMRALLAAAASLDKVDAAGDRAINYARHLAAANLLVTCEADWGEVKECVRRERLGFIEMDELDINEAQFQ